MFLIPIDLRQQIKQKILIVSLITLGMLGICSIKNVHADVTNSSMQSQNTNTSVISSDVNNKFSKALSSNNNLQNQSNNSNGSSTNINSNADYTHNHALLANSQADNRVASYDISGWQGLINSNQAQQLKNEVHFMILKADQGGYEDPDFPNNAYQLQQAHIPYGAYDYSVYSNPVQAQNEARAFVNQAPDAKFYVNDSEVNDAGSLLDSSTQAWANEIHALTNKPAILYSDLSFLNDNFSQTTRNLYNAIWVAAYGVEPDPSWHYDLWQFSSNHYSPALNQNVDASMFPDGNNKPLSFWTGHSDYSYHPARVKYHIKRKHTHRIKLHRKRNIKSNHYNNIIYVHNHKRHHSYNTIHLHRYHHRYTIKHVNKRKFYKRTKKHYMWTSSNYYHKIPQARWLEITKPSGIELWGRGHVDDGHASCGTILYVSKYIKVRDHNHYIYKAQGIHYGLPDWFTANKSFMTDNC